MCTFKNLEKNLEKTSGNPSNIKTFNKISSVIL